MATKTCPKCGAEVEAEVLDEPAFYYFCDTFGCDWREFDVEGYADRMADMADYYKDIQNDR